MIGNSPAVLNFHRLFPKLNRFICNELPVLPDHRSGPSVGLLAVCVLAGGADRFHCSDLT